MILDDCITIIVPLYSLLLSSLIKWSVCPQSDLLTHSNITSLINTLKGPVSGHYLIKIFWRLYDVLYYCIPNKMENLKETAGIID